MSGAQVILSARRLSELERVRDECLRKQKADFEGYNAVPSPIIVPLDLSKPEEMSAAVATVKEVCVADASAALSGSVSLSVSVSVLCLYLCVFVSVAVSFCVSVSVPVPVSVSVSVSVYACACACVCVCVCEHATGGIHRRWARSSWILWYTMAACQRGRLLRTCRGRCVACHITYPYLSIYLSIYLSMCVCMYIYIYI